MSIEPLLKTKDVADMLGLKEHTISQARHRRSKTINIPYVKIGRSVRYIPADVREYLRGRTV